MGKTFIAGLLLVAAGIVAIVLDGAFGLGLGSVLLGVAVGGALGLSRDGSPLGRLGAFLVGFLVAIVGYLLRILVLNESALGQILYIAIVVMIVTTVCAVTKNKLPLWAGALGIAAVVGAYELQFVASPQNIQADIFAAAAKVLFPTSLAFLASLFFSTQPESAAAESDESWTTAGSGTPSEVK